MTSSRRVVWAGGVRRAIDAKVGTKVVSSIGLGDCISSSSSWDISGSVTGSISRLKSEAELASDDDDEGLGVVSAGGDLTLRGDTRVAAGLDVVVAAMNEAAEEDETEVRRPVQAPSAAWYDREDDDELEVDADEAERGRLVTPPEETPRFEPARRVMEATLRREREKEETASHGQLRALGREAEGVATDSERGESLVKKGCVKRWTPSVLERDHA